MMFNDFDTDIGDESCSNAVKKRKQEQVEMKTEVVQSSVSRCESKFLPGCDPEVTSLPHIGTTKPPRSDAPALKNVSLPFCYFSVKELSLVKALDNWTNKKVCVVGELNYTSDAKDCVLNGVAENGSCNISLDVSSLKVNPAPHKLMQVYGVLNVSEGKPKINVSFVRNLGTAHLPLLAESYNLMQEYIPKSINAKKVLHEEKS